MQLFIAECKNDLKGYITFSYGLEHSAIESKSVASSNSCIKWHFASYNSYVGAVASAVDTVNRSTHGFIRVSCTRMAFVGMYGCIV